MDQQIQTIETCARCGYPVIPAERNVERNSRGEPQILHNLMRCFLLLDSALDKLGWPKERRAQRNIGGQLRQEAQRDPTDETT